MVFLYKRAGRLTAKTGDFRPAQTVEEYYESNVRSILTTVTQELQKNPERKFTCVHLGSAGVECV